MHLFRVPDTSPSAAPPSSRIQLGYPSQLRRNRVSTAPVLGQALAIAAVPYGMGSALTSAAVYGGGQLTLLVGLFVVLLLAGCVAASLAELASRFPTSSGVYYWSFQLLRDKDASKPASPAATVTSYIAGWFWLVGNWTITLSVNFGCASLLAATVCLYRPDWAAAPAWQLLLAFYALCLLTFIVCAAGDALLPYVDSVAAVWNLVTILIILIVILAIAGTRSGGIHPALGHYDPSPSGWDRGFAFFIGLLPPAYTFCAIGMVTSMAEECTDPEVQVPRAMALCVPVGGAAALFFVLPLCLTLPPPEDVLAGAAFGQALPYVLARALGGAAGGVAVMVPILIVTVLCSVSVTTTASRCTWAFARDGGLPLSWLWARTTTGSRQPRPLPALALVTIVQMLLGLVNLGSSSAFTAFVSVGVIGLAAGYLVPIAVSLATGRRAVSEARWRLRPVIGITVNVVSVLWILFEMVLFSMPQALPATPSSMNYASVVFVGFAVMSAAWYFVGGRQKFKGPPEEIRDVGNSIYFIVLSRCVLTIVWLGVQTTTGGQCTELLLTAIWPSFADIPNHIPKDDGITTAGMVTFLLYFFLQLPLYLNRDLGNYATLGLNIADVSRYANKPSAQNVQAICHPMHLQPYKAIVGLLGIFTAAAAQSAYGRVIWNPIEIIGLWMESGSHAGRAAAAPGAIGLVIVTLGINIFANSISAANDLMTLAPNWTFVPWKILASTQTFIAFLGGETIFQGPMTSILMTDYFLVKHRNVSVPNMYDFHGITATLLRRLQTGVP
ncbi:Amino acid/polyamine transporter I [Cordyceps fumosorosea ARSEF 2679]|uniref:Amino acid/polyamine transporter I n=1 Tax=Cordyceps fumosorosea (strain ARSEF 2679) TaxID=1081104 RepID=A0A162KBA0_CORFA|nr:Amino acid/polyamine transporter I [Cordyceps fumosorosea ARSEF 2679]OAA53176.1 Amino acid/polyamine transporter I [Cordyceps fumosorosea ARSEF 2679]